MERFVIVLSTRGDFDYSIATWLRVGAVYDIKLRLIRRYRNKLTNNIKGNIVSTIKKKLTLLLKLGLSYPAGVGTKLTNSVGKRGASLYRRGLQYTSAYLMSRAQRWPILRYRHVDPSRHWGA